MIQPSELRYNSLITFPDFEQSNFEYCEVWSIDGIAQKVEVSWDVPHKGNGTMWVDLRNMVPITITPELLERYGIHKTGSYPSGDIVYADLNIRLTYDGTFRYGLTVLKHLHMLQNLYFALAGHELEIKL